VKTQLNGKKLTIELELSSNPQPSSTGKTLIVYSSGGFAAIDGGYKINITIITPRK